MSFLDTLLKASRKGHLPTPRYFIANENGPIGFLSHEGNWVLLLYTSLADTEEGMVGHGIVGKAYRVDTLERLAALFGIAEDLGFTDLAVNPPPVKNAPMTVYGLKELF